MTAGPAAHKRLTTQDILNAIEQLEPAEAEKVSRRLLRLQAQRKAVSLTEREAELLREIYQEKRPGFQARFDELNARIHRFEASPEERQEFLELVDESESFAVRRLQALAELAQLRGTTLPALTKKLGLKAPVIG